MSRRAEPDVIRVGESWDGNSLGIGGVECLGEIFKADNYEEEYDEEELKIWNDWTVLPTIEPYKTVPAEKGQEFFKSKGTFRIFAKRSVTTLKGCFIFILFCVRALLYGADRIM